MVRLSKNFLGAAGVAVGTLIYLAEARKLPFGALRHPDIGFMPILAGLGLLGLCAILMGREILRPRVPKVREVDLFENGEKTESAGLRKPLILSAVIFVYPLAFVHLGFILATVALVTVSLWVMKYRGWAGSLAVASAVTLISYLFFGYWLNVNFPKGVIG
jgi:NADH:ubiquinone oxidoreductase subunit 3 (subunit A)